jgi:lipase chaperone LimK
MNPEAAARFAELDREEEHWKQKIANYAQAKQNVLQFNLNESETKSAINTLRSLHFNDIERKRLIAYEN